jgi:hypothetical protein
MTSQSVRATASARVAYGNAVNCMRPFAVADKWLEQVNPANEYNHWTKVGNNAVEANPHDSYVPPPGPGTPTGYKVYNANGTPADLGTQLVLKGGNNPNSNTDPITPGWFLALRLPDGTGGYNSGASDFSDAVANCIGNPVGIDDYIPTETGAMIGPTQQGFTALAATDPSATWNPGTKTVDYSCAPACAPFSPRIVPIVVFDLDEFQWRRAASNWTVCPGGGRCVRVRNILGFFASNMSGNDIVGYLLMYPGEFVVGNPAVGNNQSFLASVQLVR